MPLRPYTNDHELPYIAALVVVCAAVVMWFAGCRIDNKPRVTVWQPPVVITGAVPKPDEDGGR